ncbi:uncharacterized protein LOC120258329 [Dioscorea cayenensis subsp. rotundata]|uniref:Uncharacterized protein LOC120258329 n=1 Tax=Dioscorea cayennensis subsp. rotundata TaxID=55577 RepID=A0AB40B344_DIOCR|nr:uncharacterized protein LOC120258329 [Dioscorea cayenensis subsp. rotundata]
MSESNVTSNDDGATSRVPVKESSSVSLHYQMLTKTNYSTWAIKMSVYLQAQGVWDAIQPGTEVETRRDKIALTAIYETIPEENLLLISEKETAKEAWETLKTMYVGADRVKQAKLQTLKSEFEILRMKEAETIDEFAARLTAIVSKAAGLGGKIKESTIVKKLLVTVPNKCLPIVTSIEQFADLSTMTLEEAIGHLKTFEERIRGAGGEENESLLLMTEWKSRGKEFGRGSSSNPSKGHDKGFGRGRGRGRGCGRDTGRRNHNCDNEYEEKKKVDKRKVKCFNYNIMGHFASECRLKKEEKAYVAKKDDDEPALLMA